MYKARAVSRASGGMRVTNSAHEVQPGEIKALHTVDTRFRLGLGLRPRVDAIAELQSTIDRTGVHAVHPSSSSSTVQCMVRVTAGRFPTSRTVRKLLRAVLLIGRERFGIGCPRCSRIQVHVTSTQVRSKDRAPPSVYTRLRVYTLTCSRRRCRFFPVCLRCGCVRTPRAGCDAPARSDTTESDLG